jgi:hypothetical protein
MAETNITVFDDVTYYFDTMKFVGGYGVARNLNLKPGSLVATFSRDSYIN